MTYIFEDFVARTHGVQPGKEHWSWASFREGNYITPEGTLYNADSRAFTAHGGGPIIPFFMAYLNPDEETMRYYSREEMLENLLEWEKVLIDEDRCFNGMTSKERIIKLHLVRYLINVYRSKHLVYDELNLKFDMTKVTGLPTVPDFYYGRNRLLKDVLVQACNYDSIESQLYRAITTSKFNIYETFYDYILHDYTIYQIPKKIYDKEQEKYVDVCQSEFFIPDSELRLKQELDAIRASVPLEERKPYCRCKLKESPIDFWY